MKSRKIIKKRPSKAYSNCAVFVDGTGLDRATRRLSKRIDLSMLVDEILSSTSSSIDKVTECKYYTVLPYEDDSRHRSFLNAVESAGFKTHINRLPPKGINRFITVDIALGADIINFHKSRITTSEEDTVNRLIVVCPSKQLYYPLSLVDSKETEIFIIDFSSQSLDEFVKIPSNRLDFSNKNNIWR